jgi:signal recognition particle GTPase
MIKVDRDSKTVFCRSCKHVVNASKYNVMDFTQACLFDKKDTSTATGLADIKRHGNERLMLSLKEKELDMHLQKQHRSDAEKAYHLDLELKLEAQRFTNQEQIYKMQVDRMAAMQQIVTSVIPKKSPLDNYKKRKAAMAAMLAAGDISIEVANQLIEKLNNELFSSNLIS